MKVFLTFISTILATCHNDDPAFEVTCGADLLIQIDVNMDCMRDYWNMSSILELKLLPAGPYQPSSIDQCVPCEAGGCNREANWFQSSSMLGIVPVDATQIFFQATECGTQMLETDDYIIFNTTIGTNITIDSDTTIMTRPEIVAIPFACKYNKTIDGVAVDVGEVVIESPFAKGFNVSEANGTVDVDEVDISVVALQVDGKVIIGTNTNVTIEAIANLTEGFYFEECVATNDAQSESLTIIEDACAVFGTPLLDMIDVILTQPSFTFNQFAFIVMNGDDMELQFNMECIVKLGVAPSCTRKRRSDIQSRTRREGKEYKVEIPTSQTVGPFENEDGIAVPKQGTSGTVQVTSAIATTLFGVLMVH